MSTKKSLLALLAAAMATMAFASPALATDGVLRDVQTGSPIAAGTVLHAVGWTKNTTANASFECHVTWNIEAIGSTGTTANVTTLTVPDTTKCTYTGLYKGCTLKTHEAKNLPYHVTVTDNGRLDITGNIELHYTFSGCLVKTTLLKLSEVRLTPLLTGSRAVTGTENKLGSTAVLNEPIAGFEVDEFTANGKMIIVSSFGTKSEEALESVSGEIELTAGSRCTYQVSSS